MEKWIFIIHIKIYFCLLNEINEISLFQLLVFMQMTCSLQTSKLIRLYVVSYLVVLFFKEDKPSQIFIVVAGRTQRSFSDISKEILNPSSLVMYRGCFTQVVLFQLTNSYNIHIVLTLFPLTGIYIYRYLCCFVTQNQRCIFSAVLYSSATKIMLLNLLLLRYEYLTVF